MDPSARIVCGRIGAGPYQFISRSRAPHVNIDVRTLRRLRVLGLIAARRRRDYQRDTDYVLTAKGKATARREQAPV